MDRLKIAVHAIPPSLNEYLGNSHNFNDYRKTKEQWAWLVVQAVPLAFRGVKWQRSSVSITYFFPDDRRRDPDNYSGKFLCDGLRLAGVIADDSFKNIKLELAGELDRANPRTEIEVTRLDNEGGQDKWPNSSQKPSRSSSRSTRK